MLKASFFPESFIARIKDSANLVTMVSEVVALKKTGRNFQGSVPVSSGKNALLHG